MMPRMERSEQCHSCAVELSRGAKITVIVTSDKLLHYCSEACREAAPHRELRTATAGTVGQT